MKIHWGEASALREEIAELEDGWYDTDGEAGSACFEGPEANWPLLSGCPLFWRFAWGLLPMGPRMPNASVEPIHRLLPDVLLAHGCFVLQGQERTFKWERADLPTTLGNEALSRTIVRAGI